MEAATTRDHSSAPCARTSRACTWSGCPPTRRTSTRWSASGVISSMGAWPTSSPGTCATSTRWCEPTCTRSGVHRACSNNFGKAQNFLSLPLHPTFLKINNRHYPPLADGINALCWPRTLLGNFREVVEALPTGEGIVTIDESTLENLPLGDAGKVTRDVPPTDQQSLCAYDLRPSHLHRGHFRKPPQQRGLAAGRHQPCFICENSVRARSARRHQL